MKSIWPLEDPCPSLKGLDTGSGKGRNLLDKDRVAFAPLSELSTEGSRISVSRTGIDGSV